MEHSLLRFMLPRSWPTVAEVLSSTRPELSLFPPVTRAMAMVAGMLLAPGSKHAHRTSVASRRRQGVSQVIPFLVQKEKGGLGQVYRFYRYLQTHEVRW